MAWRDDVGRTNYVAAKAGVVGMTKSLAANAIAPGLIETPCSPR
jgi:3-oxoacyl-[acyl-carrier protein] reductase